MDRKGTDIFVVKLNVQRISFLSNLFEKHIQKDHVQDKKLK